MVRFIKKLIPGSLMSMYHFLLAWGGAMRYKFPSRKLYVIGITGTKGKTTATEILNSILEAAGYTTAVFSSLRFKIADDERINTTGTTMPGRFAVQKLLHKAALAHCDYAIIEVSSQGISQHRHRFIDFDSVFMLNLAPEHIEAHGSFERYREEKGKLFDALAESRKKNTIAILNADDEQYEFYKKRARAHTVISCTKKAVSQYAEGPYGMSFLYGQDYFHTALTGYYNLDAILSAIEFAKARGVAVEVIKKAFSNLKTPPGRFEFIQKKPFSVIVDYAHTPASLEAVYETAKRMQDHGELNLVTNYHEPGPRIICVLGGTGGGRDKWKWPVMGEIASRYCDEIILTSEDPYDDDPKEIIRQIRSGMNMGVIGTMDILEVVDRKRAIEAAISHARDGDLVIITGKGSEPWMFLERGKKIPWSDKKIVEQALAEHGK